MSLSQPTAPLNFVGVDISNFSKFKLKGYDVKILIEEVKIFIRARTWAALQCYNEIRDYKSARKYLRIALHFGYPISLTVARQWLKHYIILTVLLRS